MYPTRPSRATELSGPDRSALSRSASLPSCPLFSSLSSPPGPPSRRYLYTTDLLISVSEAFRLSSTAPSLELEEESFPPSLPLSRFLPLLASPRTKGKIFHSPIHLSCSCSSSSELSATTKAVSMLIRIEGEPTSSSSSSSSSELMISIDSHHRRRWRWVHPLLWLTIVVKVGVVGRSSRIHRA